MRYTVRFAHTQYLDLVEHMVRDPEFRLPEGIYRGIDVVVEASDAETALRRAGERLGWPDHELSLIPFNVTSELQTRALTEAMRGTRALLDVWTRTGLLRASDDVAAAVGIHPR